MFKIFIIIFSFLVIESLISSPTFAQTSELSSLEEFQKNLKICATRGTINLDCWVSGSRDFGKKGSSGVVSAIFESMSTSLVGPLPEGNITVENYQPGGAIGALSSWITALYTTQPASAGDYLADVAVNLNLVPKAYAQGFGTSQINALLPFWKATRNLSYVFFILVFIITGFSIMFRIKIDPKTTVSIQNSLPKIVITLILVTFSYAIAGFLIDLMYVLYYLAINVFKSGGAITANEATQMINDYHGNIISTLGAMANRGLSAILNLLKGIIPGI